MGVDVDHIDGGVVLQHADPPVADEGRVSVLPYTHAAIAGRSSAIARASAASLPTKVLETPAGAGISRIVSPKEFVRVPVGWLPVSPRAGGVVGIRAVSARCATRGRPGPA